MGLLMPEQTLSRELSVFRCTRTDAYATNTLTVTLHLKLYPNGYSPIGVIVLLYFALLRGTDVPWNISPRLTFGADTILIP